MLQPAGIPVRAIRLNPQLALAYLNRASAYTDLDQPEQATADLDKACQLDKAYCLSDNPPYFLPTTVPTPTRR